MVGPEVVGVVNRALEAGQAAAAAAYATAAATAPPTELGALANAVARAVGGEAALAAAPHVTRLCLPPPWTIPAAARRVVDSLAAARLPPWPASARALEDYMPMALGALEAPARVQAMARPPLSLLVACGLLAQAAADRVAAALRSQPPVLWQVTPALAALRSAPPDGLDAVLATLGAPAQSATPAGTPKRRLRQYGPLPAYASADAAVQHTHHMCGEPWRCHSRCRADSPSGKRLSTHPVDGASSVAEQLRDELAAAIAAERARWASFDQLIASSIGKSAAR